jgi:pilus assembly protein FimV
MLQQNMLPIAAGGVGLLGLVGWLVARRRREEDDGPETPRVVDDAAVVEAAAELPPEVEADLEPATLGAEATSESQLRDSAFLDEFSPSDINALQDETGEVDPVSEADVYIAYGRYQQAEDLLHQAMEREPDRLALKHKLLEVHYATRSPDAYVKLAQQMADAGQDAADEEAWKRAQDMGRELAPENPLFAAPDGEAAEGFRIAAAGAAGAAAASVDSDTLTLDDAELSELTAAYDEPTDTANDLEAPSEVSIMLDMDDSVDVAARAPDALEDSAATSEFASIDFELPTVEKDDGPTPTAEQGQTGDDPLDLDSMLAEAESVIDREDSLVSLDSDFSPDDLQAQLDELSDLSMFDSDLEAAADESAPSGIGLVSEDSGSGDVGLDEPLNLDSAFEMAEEAAEAAPGSEMASAEAGVEGEDDVETKLDLARAYVDMGDEDGARSILQEVVVEGSDTQRDDAQQLLSSLG